MADNITSHIYISGLEDRELFFVPRLDRTDPSLNQITDVLRLEKHTIDMDAGPLIPSGELSLLTVDFRLGPPPRDTTQGVYTARVTV